MWIDCSLCMRWTGGTGRCRRWCCLVIRERGPEWRGPYDGSMKASTEIICGSSLVWIGRTRSVRMREWCWRCTMRIMLCKINGIGRRYAGRLTSIFCNLFGVMHSALHYLISNPIGFINRLPTEWSHRSQASAIMGSSDASSSFDMFNVRSRCCLSNGAQEKDSKRVEANVWPPIGAPWGNGASSWGWGGGSCWRSGGITGWYWPSGVAL